MNTEALVLAEPREPVSMELFTLLRDQASALIKTGFLPDHLKTPEQAVAVILIGRELGVPMMQALRKVFVILGTPALAAELMLALAERTNEVEDVRIEDDGATCTVTVKRKGRNSPVTTSFSMKDAEAMGLSKKDNWTKQPAVMRRWRAIAANLRLTFPDAIGGMYSVEEIAPDMALDMTGTPMAPPMERTPSPATLMPRKVGETPPPIPDGSVIPAPPATDQATWPEIIEAMFPTAAGGPSPSPEATPGREEPTPERGDTGTLPMSSLEPLAVQLAARRSGASGDTPVVFMIGKQEYRTRGITRQQMLWTFDLEDRVEKKQKGLSKAILRTFGVQHRVDLTVTEAEKFIIRLCETVGLDPPWVKAEGHAKR